MRKTTYRTIAAAATAAIIFTATSIFTGCQGSEEPVNKVEEGLPVSLSFSVEVPEMQDITITRASDDVETAIEKMAILFYNAKQANSKPVIVKIDDLGQPTKTTSTNWLYTINLSEEQLDGVYSGEWRMYPIANYDKYATFDLSDLATKTISEFKEYTVTASGRDITSTAVMMSGRYGTDDNTTITLQPGINTFDNVFHLKRIVSKNIFTFENGTGVTFTPQKYSIHNYSTSATLLERAELNEYAGAGTFTDFTDLPVSGNSFTFYMPENTQIPAAKDTWSYADREKRTAANYNIFEYAPANSTYIVVEGLYEGPGEDSEGATGNVTGNVRYTIHLGNFDTGAGKGGSYGNFTVKRNAKYNYKVKVNGVNNIIVEAETDVENNPGAEGQIVRPAPHVVVNLDAHYENVILTFNASGIANYNVGATTPNTSGRMETFLDVNGADKAKHTDAVSWVKFGKPASASTFNNYPANASDVVDIYTLIDEIKAGTYTHCLKDGDNVSVQAYVDEYFYEDGRPYGSFVNADDRVLSFVIGNAKNSSDGQSSYIKGEGFTLKQKSIKTFYNDNAGNPFGLETVEETPEAALTSNDSDNLYGEDYQNGRNDTWRNISATGAGWSTIVNIAANGHIGADAVTTSNVMQSSYNSPAYQCLSRNRDLNGDGVITKDEVKWYLPSFRQFIYTWFGKKSLPSEINFTSSTYATSSNKGYRLWWADEGVAIESWSSGSTSGTRCVRNLGTSIDEDFSAISSYNNDTKVVTITGLKTEALRTNEQSGEYPEHINTDASSTLPKVFKIAKANLSTEVEVESTDDPEFSVTTNYSTYANTLLTNLIDGNNSTYWWSNGAQAAGQYVQISSTVPIKVNSVQIYSSNSTDYPKNQTLQISADGEDWKDIGTVNGRNVTVSNTAVSDLYVYYIRLYQKASGVDNWLYLNEITINYTKPEGTVTMPKKNFKYDELMTGDWCEKRYSEEADASDLGKWRIPNEKELYFIQLYCSTEFNLKAASNDNGELIGGKTKYYRNADFGYMIYYLRKDGSANTPIITTGTQPITEWKFYDFKLRCVRDAAPSSTNHDSSYNSGGTGFGL